MQNAAIGRVLAPFRRIMRLLAYVTGISLTGIPARAPSMLLNAIRVGPNTYIGVSRACDGAMAAPSSVSRALLDPFLRGVTFWPLRAWTRSWQIRQIDSVILKLIEHENY